MEGVDYSTQRPNPVLMAKAGIKFACRYVGGGSADKHLTATERDALHAAGIAIVANFESTQSRALGGFQAGSDDGDLADRAMRELGFPPTLPCYFSVDFDATDRQLPIVADYFRGVATQLPLARIGVYGGINTVNYLAGHQLARYFWQTYAWSHGRWAGVNHIQQYLNGQTLWRGRVDLDRSTAPDFGGWLPMTNPAGSTPDVIAIGDQVLNRTLVRVMSTTGHTDYTLASAIELLIHNQWADATEAKHLESILTGLATAVAAGPVDLDALAAAIVRDPSFQGALHAAMEDLAGPRPTAREIADAIVTAYGERLMAPPPSPAETPALAASQTP
jgi:hypothetical protein